MRIDFLNEDSGQSTMRVISLIMVFVPMVILFKQAFSNEVIEWFSALSMMTAGGGLKAAQKITELKHKNKV